MVDGRTRLLQDRGTGNPYRAYPAGRSLHIMAISSSSEHFVPMAEKLAPVAPARQLDRTGARRPGKNAAEGSRLKLPRSEESRQVSSIFAHWASVGTNRSIQSLNHHQASGGILILNRP
jgi:hypothetical protein